MSHIGVISHVYHLQTEGWENLVWGNPKKDQLGTLPKLVELLLTESPNEPITTIVIYSGPSQKDGLTEGAYAKQFLLDHFNDLAAFPSLKRTLDTFTKTQNTKLRQRLDSIILGPLLKNTTQEVEMAAKEFAKHGVTKVIQVAAASHAPRCIQAQLIARTAGNIPKDQLWSVVASDTYFLGTQPDDLLIFEPPHRGDDPMTKVYPTAPQVLRAFFELDSYKKQHFIAVTERLLQDYKDQQL